ESADEIKVLKNYFALVERETAAIKNLIEAQAALIKKVTAKYPKLSEEEIKSLVVEDKWLATLAAAVRGELDRVSQMLTGRIRELAERYSIPLPKLTDEVAALATRVDAHLEKIRAVGT